MALILRTGDESGDVLQAGSGGVELRGLGGNDTLFGGPDVDSLNGNTDDDVVIGSGNDSVFGGTGNDTVIGTEDGDRVLGNKGNDIVVGPGTLYGGQDQDTLFGGEVGNGDLGDDLIYTGVTADGGEGNDTIVGSTGSNTFTGGVGNDQFVIQFQEVRTVAPGTEAETVTVGGYGGTDTITDFQEGPGTGDIIKLAALDNGSTVKVAQTGSDVTVSVAGTAYNANTASTQSAAQTIVIKNIALQDFIASGSDDLQVNNTFVSTTNAVGVSVNNLTEYFYEVGTEGPGFNIVGTAQGDQISANSAGGLLNTTFNNDTVFGDLGDDSIDGLAGNDSLSAGSGNDTVRGGAGDDTIIGGFGDVSKPRRDANGNLTPLVVDAETAAGTDHLYGDAGNDSILGEGEILSTSGFAEDYIDGGEGDDTLWGQGGDDTVIGGAGNDVINTGSDNDYANGGEGNDFIEADDASDESVARYTTASGFGNYSVDGLQPAADDRLFNDVLVGGAGSDTIFAGNGTDYVSGGDDNDELYGEGGDDVIVGLAGNDMASGGLGDDSVLGGDDNDTLFGNESEDTLRGEAGDDSLVGGSGNDLLSGGKGNDYIDGESDGQQGTVDIKSATLNVIDTNEDELPDTFTGSNLIDDDEISAIFNGTGVFGDVASYADATGSVNVSLVNGLATGSEGTDTLKDIEHVLGGSSADVITGDAGANLLVGGGGDDVIDGLGGNDYLYGGTGDDELFGNAGDDTVNGAAGDDSLEGNAGNDVIITGNGEDGVDGGTGNDTVFVNGTGRKFVVGNLGADQINIAAGSGNTTVVFQSVNDGAAPGATTGFDVITGFDAGDRTQIGPDLFPEINDVQLQGDIDFREVAAGDTLFSNGVGTPPFILGANYDEAAFINANAANLADPSVVAAAINGFVGAIIETDTWANDQTNDLLLFVSGIFDGAPSTGVYYYRVIQAGGPAGAIEANELSTLGIFQGVTSAVTQSSFNNGEFGF